MTLYIVFSSVLVAIKCWPGFHCNTSAGMASTCFVLIWGVGLLDVQETQYQPKCNAYAANKNSAFARNQSKKKVIFQSLLLWRGGISLWEGMSRICPHPLQKITTSNSQISELNSLLLNAGIEGKTA